MHNAGVKRKPAFFPTKHDRIAILLAIPIAVFGFFYSSKKYSEKRAISD